MDDKAVIKRSGETIFLERVDDSKLEAMSELERYKLFMNVGDSPRAASVREQIEKKRKRTKNVLGLFGTAPMYGVGSTEEIEDGDDSDDEDNEDVINAFLDS